MGDRLTASASGLINADPAAIWAVITDPRQLGQAFFGATVDTDWRVGSPITYRGEWEGKSFEDKGRNREVRSRTSSCSSPTSARSAASPTFRRTTTQSPSS